VSPGQATITATSEGESDSTSLEVVQWATIDAGKYFSCAALTDGEAYCWGENDRGELGIGSTGGVFSEPQRVQTTQRFTEISSGFFHNCGLTINQNIYCWGQGGNGALGNGQTSVSNVPVRVTGAYTFVQVSAGINHSCGLDASDNIQCWGINQDGQLGNATSQDSLIPQTVAGGHTWSKVSAGGLHTCGLTAGGEIFCWGANGLGQLGTGNTVPTNSPVAIDSSETFTDLSVGVDHSCATTSSGSVYCWGSNMHGEIGLDSNSATQRNSPVQVSVSGASFESLESGSGFTCAIAGSGEAWCWGFNGQVNFGNGTVEANQFTPVRISGGYSWSSLGGGLQHMCGLNGQVDAYCWGDNDQGESGTGSTSDLNASPTAVNRPTL
jgi:alpha-tubulin suppressor-like RCC1 family protein